jgi:hypothetical protein
MKTWGVSLLSFICGVAITLGFVATGVFAPLCPSISNDEWGKFPASAKVELLDDGRQLKLLEDFVYLDPRGRAWTANKDSVVNGASIPRVFWTITGGPLEGKYRNASIVHDEWCVRMTETSEKVHLMFYEACRCGGVPEYQAKLLYAAVCHFGPKWTLEQVSEERMSVGSDGKTESIIVTRMVPNIEESSEEDPTADLLDRLDAYIKDKNPSLADIATLNIDSL